MTNHQFRLDEEMAVANRKWGGRLCLIEIILILILLFFIVRGCSAADVWTPEDTYREIAFQVFLFLDFGQTLTIARHPESYRELNPVLGEHPGQEKVGVYFLLNSPLHFFVSYALPNPYRKYWQYVTLGFEAGIVGSNFNLGINFSW